MEDQKDTSILIRLVLLYLASVGTNTGIGQISYITRNEFSSELKTYTYRLDKVENNCKETSSDLHKLETVVTNLPYKEWRDRILQLEKDVYWNNKDRRN